MSEEFRNNSEIPPSDPDRERDAAARFAAYTARLAALVHSRLARGFRPRLDAEDVVASAWRSFLVGVREDRWDLETTNLWPLLATIVTRKLHKQIRRNRDADRAVPFDPMDVAANAPTIDEVATATEALESAINNLDPLDHEVVLLRLRGDSTAEIAAATGASERSINRAYARACDTLRAFAEIGLMDIRRIQRAGCLHQLASNDSEVSVGWTVRGELPQLHYSNLKLQRLMGQGGIGRVYRAVDRTTGSNVAVKFLRKQFWKHPIALQSLAAEIETLCRIHHPGVVRPVGWGRTPSGTPFIASELIEGQTLDDWSRSTGASRTRKLSRLMLVADALSAVHAAGIVHGDVTPANILCEPSGRVVLVDFGLATTIHAPAIQKTGATLAFAAPEQVSPGFGPIGPWTDIYGFAATAFTTFTGSALPQGATRTELIASIVNGEQSRLEACLKPLVPPGIVAVLSQCVCTTPRRRPETISTVAQALQSSL